MWGQTFIYDLVRCKEIFTPHFSSKGARRAETGLAEEAPVKSRGFSHFTCSLRAKRIILPNVARFRRFGESVGATSNSAPDKPWAISAFAALLSFRRATRLRSRIRGPARDHLVL